MSTPARQLTITIPDGVLPGSLLKIPIGEAEKITARVPEGLTAGSTLVLTKVEGSDEWVEGVGDEQPLSDKTHTNQDGFGDGLEETLKPPAPRKDPEPRSVTPKVPANEPVAYTVRLETNVGDIDIIVRPDWAPHGVRRFLDLAASGDLDELAFYRSVKGCLAQFGLPARRVWPSIPDDSPIGVPFLLGAVCFAAVGENSRRSTLFICIGDMSHCFGQQAWETPIGAVAESSLPVLDRIETDYGDIAECQGAGPNAGRINIEGNAYLRSEFPLLSYIRSARPLDWEPPIQEVEQIELAAQAVKAVQIAQSVHAAETAANAAHASQAARAAKAMAAAELAKAHKTDTGEWLKKLDAQEKVHQAAMKEMEKKLAEAVETTQSAHSTSSLNRLNETHGNSMVRGSNEQSFSNCPRLIEVPVEILPQAPNRESLRVDPRVDPRVHAGRSLSPRPAASRTLSRSPSNNSFSDARHAPVVSHSVIYDNSAMLASSSGRLPSRPIESHARYAYDQSPRSLTLPPPHHFPHPAEMPPPHNFPQPSHQFGRQPLGNQSVSPTRHHRDLYPSSRASSPMPSFPHPHPGAHQSPNIYQWQFGAPPPRFSPPQSPQYPMSHQAPPRWPMY